MLRFEVPLQGFIQIVLLGGGGGRGENRIFARIAHANFKPHPLCSTPHSVLVIV